MPKCDFILKSHFSMGFLPLIRCIFSEQLFLRTPGRLLLDVVECLFGIHLKCLFLSLKAWVKQNYHEKTLV